MTSISRNNASALSHLSAVAQHLVFTLLLLALGVSNAQAATQTIFSLEVTATQNVKLAAGEDLNLTASYVTISGGSALVHNGHSSSAANMIEPGLVSIKNSGGSYLKITLTSETLQAGDVISIGTSESNATFYFTGQSTKNESIPVAALTYTVTSSDELNNKNVLYIWRNTNSKLSSLTITRPAASYTYTINAVDNSTPSNFIKTIATGTVGDQAITVYHQKIINVNGTFYETDDMTFQHNFEAATGSSTNVTVNVQYKANNKIKVYIEGENYTSYTFPTGNYSNGTYGNVIGGTPAVIAESLPAGKYTFKAYLLTNDAKSAGRGFYVRDGSVDDYSKQLVSLDLSNPTNKEYTGDFEIYATKPITLAGWQSSNKSKTNQSADFDYAYIEYKSAVTPVTSISLDKSTLNFTKTTNGFSPASATLTATLSPNNPTNKDVIWTSDDTNIATVSSGEVTADNNGQASVTVTAKGPGTAVITAKAKGGGDDILATCTVNVEGNSTVNDLTEITSNYSYSPNQEFIRGVLYNNNTLLSINGDEFYEDGVNVGGTSKAIAFKVAANATVRVTFKNRGGGTRTARIGTSQNGTEIASQSLASNETAEVIGHRADEGLVYLTSDKPLYITKIEVLFSPKYTVTYNGNGHGTPAYSSGTESSPLQGVTLPGVTANEGYQFLGWATTAGATTADAGITGDTYKPSANVTLYALYRTSGVTLEYVKAHDHTLTVGNNNTYSYRIGTAYTPTTMVVEIKPSSTATVTVDDQTSEVGTAITTTVTLGETKTVTVTDNQNNTATYTLDLSKVDEITTSGDSYAIQNRIYYEGQVIRGNHINAYISHTAGGAELNTAGSNYGELTTQSQSYNGDIAYSNYLYNGNGRDPEFNSTTGAPDKGCFYAFSPTVGGVLEVAVKIDAGKKLYVVEKNGSETSILTKGTNYTTTFELNESNEPSSNVYAGSIRINATGGRTYYVYAESTKMGILGFALNEYLYVTSEGQTYTLSSTNYAHDAFFTKDKATETVNHGGEQIYRIKNSSDKVTVKVKNAKSVAAVIYNSAGSARSFTISVDGVIVGTEAAAANDETTSQYYTINPDGSTITLAGTGSDIYAYQLIFSNNQYSSISVKDGSDNSVTAVTMYVDDYNATYTVSSNSSATINLNATGVSGIAGVTLSGGTLTIDPTAAGTGNIVLSQSASGDYQAGSRTIALTVKKHSLKLILTHNGSDSYTHNITTNTVTGSYYKGSNDSYGGSSTAWTVTALKDGDETQPVEPGLIYKYVSDVEGVATVVESTGVTTIKDDAVGTAYITVYTEGNNTYEAAKTQFSVTVQQGYDVKINSGVTPALNSRYEAKRGSQVLCTMIAGGYKYNSGTLFGAKDKWGKSSAYDDKNGYTCQIDGFIQQSQAGVDSSNEFGQGIEWYVDGKKKRIKPFSLPVRGAYLKFEPEVNGVLTAYVLQNGDMTMDTEGDGLPYEIGKAPRVYYWFDQNGYRIEPTEVTSKLPLCYGRDYTKDGVQVFYDNGHDEHNLNDWYDNNLGLQTLYEVGTAETGYKPQWPTQAEVDENLAKIIPDPQPVVRYNDGYSVHQKAYVKYQLKVIAGNTYYFFSNVSKVGFAGFNFNPSDDGSLTCVAYNDNGTTFNIDVTTNETQQTMDQSTDTEDTFKPKEGGNIKNNAIVAYETVKMPRTFKVNTWNTITLPFSLTETQVEQVFGVGTILVTYNGVGRGGGQSTAFFLRHVDQNILAGQPYFIKPTGKDAEGENLSTVDNNGYLGGANKNAGITFTNVNCEYKLNSQNYEQDTYKESGSCAYKNTDLKCVGTLAKTNVATGDYYINATNGNLYEYTGNNSTTIPAYRAFLKQTGTSQVKLAGISYSGLDGVDWEEEATGIMEVLVNDMGVEIAPVQGVYNLNGQKVGDSTKGLPAGLYIVNGKVINIK